MPTLIDGHNLIGRMATISLADQDDEEKLIRALISFQSRTGKRLTVVFDPGLVYASPETWRRGGLEVVFVSHGSSADRVIERRVRDSQNPQDWLVVTSDLELAERVGRLGARVRSAEDFAAELLGRPSDAAGDERGDATLSPAEVEEWLAVFGGDEDASSPQKAGNDFLAIYGESD